jgi:hypothetical protein
MVNSAAQTELMVIPARKESRKKTDSIFVFIMISAKKYG